jgi:hypothetical protein
MLPQARFDMEQTGLLGKLDLEYRLESTRIIIHPPPANNTNTKRKKKT